jgi:hypothetical protein
MSKKNVIFWTGVRNPEHNEKYGGFEWMNFSKESWKYWCKNNDIIFYEYNKPSESDLMKHRVTWQRWFDIYNFLDKDKIEYNKIFMVDASTIIRWYSPNIFGLCNDDKFVAWRDFDNLAWVYDCVEGWKSYFNNFNFDYTKYINAGGVIINENHKQFIKEFKEMYYNDYDKVMKYMYDVKKGTDQGPLNFMLQIKNIDMNLEIPISYQVTHMHRKDLFSYNWQLNEDRTPFFIKYFYIWKFNGFDKNQRTKIMGDVWNFIKHNYNN